MNKNHAMIQTLLAENVELKLEIEGLRNKEFRNSIVRIPKGITNGNMVTKMLKPCVPKLIVKEVLDVEADECVIKVIGHDLNDNAVFNCTYKLDWWNTPAKIDIIIDINNEYSNITNALGMEAIIKEKE